jgi:hypothetical protein
MRERRGPFGRAAGVAAGAAATMRRIQQAREPRVALYDGAGAPRLIGSDDAAYDPLLDTCERMVELAGEARPGGEEGRTGAVEEAEPPPGEAE